MTITTKAAARRWFAARIGQEVETLFVMPSGNTYEPGPRTVSQAGTRFKLDKSIAVLEGVSSVVLAVTDARLRMECQDEEGITWQWVTYSDPVSSDVDD